MFERGRDRLRGVLQKPKTEGGVLSRFRKKKPQENILPDALNDIEARGRTTIDRYLIKLSNERKKSDSIVDRQKFDS